MLQAPEIMLGQKYDAKVDLWSVGVILHGEERIRKCVHMEFDIAHGSVSLKRICGQALLDKIFAFKSS